MNQQASQPLVTAWRRLELSCAHQIPNHPGKCRNLHGHNYVVEVGVTAAVDPETGMVFDFGDIKEHMNLVIHGPCDHKYLNDVYPDMLTTAENLAVRWLKELRERCSPCYDVVRIYETSNCFVEARDERYTRPNSGQ